MQLLYNRKWLKSRRQRLRRNATRTEKILWKMLQGSQLEGRKFRRQQGIGSYIVDFCCPSERLIVEVDGPVHEEEEVIAYDRRRDTFLRSKGYVVLRIAAGDLFHNADLVIEKIRSCWRASGN